MLAGIKFHCHPSTAQKQVLSQWMGCARVIWNAKCDENVYLTRYARRYLPVGTDAPIDQTFSQYKTELSPWLKECPSQILRNSAAKWFRTYGKFIKGLYGKPKRKLASGDGSIHITRELFTLKPGADGVTRLFIGSKTNNIGILSVEFHGDYAVPKSLYIKKSYGRYTVSFCYEDKVGESDLPTNKDHLTYLNSATRAELDETVVGIDRGITRPMQAGREVYDFTKGQKKNKRSAERYVKNVQKKMARQKKGSHRRSGIKRRLSRKHGKIANIRHDVCHQASRAPVNSPAKVFLFEDL